MAVVTNCAGRSPFVLNGNGKLNDQDTELQASSKFIMSLLVQSRSKLLINLVSIEKTKMYVTNWLPTLLLLFFTSHFECSNVSLCQN